MMNKLKEGDTKSLKILHLAFMAGPMLLAVIIYYLMQSVGDFKYSSRSMFFIVAAILILLSIIIGTKIYNTNINNAAKRNFASYSVALRNFRAANLIKWLMLVATTNVGIILAFLDHNPFIFFPVMAGVFYLFASKPNEEHFGYYKYNTEE